MLGLLLSGLLGLGLGAGGLFLVLRGRLQVAETARKAKRELERYPTAFSVMRVSKWDQNLGQVTSNPHRARALAKEEAAKDPLVTITLVEYRPFKLLEF